MNLAGRFAYRCCASSTRSGPEVDSEIVQGEVLGEHAVGGAGRAADLERADRAVRDLPTQSRHKATRVAMPLGVQPTVYRIEVLQLLVELCRYLRTHVGSGRWLRQV